MEAEKQTFLGNGWYTCGRGTRQATVEEQCFPWYGAARVFTKRCGKHISAAVNQHATIEEAVFSVDQLPGYIRRISHS
jgi:hypothetical protein